MACVLEGFMEWLDPTVVWELEKLFATKDPEEAAGFIHMARKEVWADAYKGHLEFMAELKKYYR